MLKATRDINSIYKQQFRTLHNSFIFLKISVCLISQNTNFFWSQNTSIHNNDIVFIINSSLHDFPRLWRGIPIYMICLFDFCRQFNFNESVDWLCYNDNVGMLLMYLCNCKVINCVTGIWLLYLYISKVWSHIFLISCTISIFILSAIRIACFFYETITITKTSTIQKISEIAVICSKIQNCVP